MIEVHFINVGYGDAALILHQERGAQRFAMLVDCGGETTGGDDPTGFRVTAADYLKTLGVEMLDVVLLSHLHLDHSGGVMAVAGNFTIGELWTSYVPDESCWEQEIRVNEALDPGPANLVKSLDIYAGALKRLRAGKTAISAAASGFERRHPFGALRLRAGDPALHARQAGILDRVFAGGAENAPLKELDGFINDTSLRLELLAPGASFLFVGDACAREWEKEDIGPFDVVKIPHHGHADSLNEAIVQKLKPAYAVVSVSNTRTDRCPDPGIIGMLEAAGARILFTDAVGTPADPSPRAHCSVILTVDEGKIRQGVLV